MQQTLTIPMRQPHSAKQWAMVTYPGNVVAFAGRRFGKTDAYVLRLFYHMQRTPGLYWWVGLSWRSASMKRAFRLVTYYARRILRMLGLDDRGYINRSTSEVRIPGLGEIWFRTADNPSSMAGEGIRGAVIDEFSLAQEIVWTEYIQATLLDFGGWAAFGGVPKGRNWAANLWYAAADREGWCQIHATSYDNPYMSSERLDKIRTETSEILFRQEYLAEVIEGEGMVFRNVMACATAEAQGQAMTGHDYIISADWAISNDFTVLTVFDLNERAIVWIDRFNQIDYVLQAARLKALAQRFRPIEVVAESNAMGLPIIQQLASDGLPMAVFNTTGPTKNKAIQDLSLAFDKFDIRIIPDPVLIRELEAYEVKKIGLNSLPVYGAPEGMHDDTVMSAAIGWTRLARQGSIFV